MFELPLAEWERNELTSICVYWLQPHGSLEAQISRIQKAFRRWKQDQTNADGMINVQGRVGLLALLQAEELRPASDVNAWECAGPDVSDGIGLAFKLWLDGYMPFLDVVLTDGLQQTFSLVGIMFIHDATRQSLIRLNGFLGSFLMLKARRDAEHAEKHRKSTRHLPKAREKSNQKRTERARELSAKAHQLAIDYRHNHPMADEDQIITYLQTFDDFKSWKGKSASSFKRAIRGPRNAMLRRLEIKRPA
jgi:hypothetical protein